MDFAKGKNSMKKEEFMSYLPNYSFGILSTIAEDGRPEGRGWEFQYEENGRFYFGTANTKAVYQQLLAHPKAAFTSMEPQGKYTVRINGEANFVTDAAEKAACWAKIDPHVQKMYQSVENPAFEILYLDHCNCKLAKGFNPTEVVE